MVLIKQQLFCGKGKQMKRILQIDNALRLFLIIRSIIVKKLFAWYQDVNLGVHLVDGVKKPYSQETFGSYVFYLWISMVNFLD